MPATRDGKTWRSQLYYEDWQGVYAIKRTKEALRQKQKQRSGSGTFVNSGEKIWILTLRILLKSIFLIWRTDLEKARLRINDMCLI